MFELSPHLATTGSDSLILYFVIGGILLVAGIALIVFRALRGRKKMTDGDRVTDAGSEHTSA